LGEILNARNVLDEDRMIRVRNKAKSRQGVCVRRDFGGEPCREEKKKKQVRALGMLAGILLMLFFVACHQALDKKLAELNRGSAEPSGIVVDYPRNGTIFPPEMPAPEFLWHDPFPGEGKYLFSVTTREGEELVTQRVTSRNWRPEPEVWETLKSVSKHETLFFTLAGKGKGIFKNTLSSGRISFSFSSDSVGASVFFREVPLPFGYAVNHVDEIEWYMGRVDGGKPRRVLANIPVCANCHSFTKDGSHIAMDVDYANDKGSYIVAPVEDTINMTFDKIITWSDYKREDGERTFGLLSQISPDGRYVLSTVKDRSVFVPVDNLMYSQLFFPIKGILAFYDSEKEVFKALPGADDPSLVQSNPNWSPDGKEVLFSRASRYYSAALAKSDDIVVNPEDVMEFINHEKDFKFDLYRLPFNEGSGGEPQPVPGASHNDLSNFFARYSPDGKWVVFCQAENFMLLQPDSKLYIMPAEGGTPRLMNCNTGNMNSWHSWSPNGRWLVFSSKERGPDTQLYLTHIDEKGNDSPAVLLENLVFPEQAANIPEFVDDSHRKLIALVDSFSQSAFYYVSMARSEITHREFVSAHRNLEKAIALDSNYFDAYLEKITLDVRLGQTGREENILDQGKAYRLINERLQKKPDDPSLLLKRANLEYYTAREEEALNDVLKAVELNPGYYDGYELLALLYQKKGDHQGTLNAYRKLLDLNPNDKFTKFNLALFYKNQRNLDPANRLADELIHSFPDEARFYGLKADLLYMTGDNEGVRNILDQAIVENPASYEGYLKRGLFLETQKQQDLAEMDFKKAIALLTAQIEQNPEDLEFLLFRSELYEKMGDVEHALLDYEKILTFLPMNYKILTRKAQLEYARKQWQETQRTHTLLIENFVPQSDFYFNRCYANIMLGNREQAVADLNTAQDLSKNNSYRLYDLAILRINLEDYDGARKDLEKLASFLSEKRKKGTYNDGDIKLQAMISEQLQNLN
jgi:tetratricopeptide (TPR) repeat protein